VYFRSMVFMEQKPYRDKKVVGIFVHFSLLNFTEVSTTLKLAIHFISN
jgi:hypothetical protein